MEFLEKLIARTHKGSPLVPGSLSSLAEDARDERWIEQCVAVIGTQESSFATHLLMRALRSADVVVAKIEADELAPAFFRGASRDVLLYEVLHFCLHRLSAVIRGKVPSDAIGASIHFSSLAFLAAGELGLQHLGDFDVSGHRLERAKRYVSYTDRLPEMTDCLMEVLLAARSRSSFQQSEPSLAAEIDLASQISLRTVVHAAVAGCTYESAEKLLEHYANRFDLSRYESERNRGFLAMRTQVDEALC